ncbi:MAG: DUF6368 family protein [Hyphomonadaceae bacterium]|nr:DUF6368 family protein [Hyphomonadaceae bacterium]
MAGPAILVLTPRKMSGTNRQEVETLLSAWSGGLNVAGRNHDFRVTGRPFLMWFGSENTEDEVEPDLPPDLPIGFVPQGQVGLAAMCNQTVDHVLLASLASRLSAILEGIILLDGELAVDERTRGFSGLTSIGPNYHAATADFIHHWIESPSFRLPK